MTDKSPIHASVDFAKTGKQIGHLGVPYSHNLGGWASMMLPIAVVSHGSGPTALVMAGNHGDEYEGPITLGELIRTLATIHRLSVIIIEHDINFVRGLKVPVTVLHLGRVLLQGSFDEVSENDQVRNVYLGHV